MTSDSDALADSQMGHHRVGMLSPERTNPITSPHAPAQKIGISSTFSATSFDGSSASCGGTPDECWSR